MNKNENKYFNTAKKMNDALIALLETKEIRIYHNQGNMPYCECK